MSLGRLAVVSLLAMLVAFGCMPEEKETPSADHVPALTARINQLQQAVLARDRAGLDSLMSDNLRGERGGVDSLLKFVYGPDGSFPLKQFGDYDIVYVETKARIDCYVMDSTASHDRPVVFTFDLKDDTLWLLKNFEDRKAPAVADSLSDPSGD